MVLEVTILIGTGDRRLVLISEEAGFQPQNPVTSGQQQRVMRAEQCRTTTRTNHTDPIETSTPEVCVSSHQELVDGQDVAGGVEEERHL
jgi:hypothetical protein